jgi:hypothetical protein
LCHAIARSGALLTAIVVSAAARCRSWRCGVRALFRLRSVAAIGDLAMIARSPHRR